MLLLVEHWPNPTEWLLVSFPDPIPLKESVERDYMAPGGDRKTTKALCAI